MISSGKRKLVVLQVMEFRKNIMMVCKSAVEERDRDGEGRRRSSTPSFRQEVSGPVRLPSGGGGQ